MRSNSRNVLGVIVLWKIDDQLGTVPGRLESTNICFAGISSRAHAVRFYHKPTYIRFEILQTTVYVYWLQQYDIG